MKIKLLLPLMLTFTNSFGLTVNNSMNEPIKVYLERCVGPLNCLLADSKKIHPKTTAHFQLDKSSLDYIVEFYKFSPQEKEIDFFFISTSPQCKITLFKNSEKDILFNTTPQCKDNSSWF